MTDTDVPKGPGEGDDGVASPPWWRRWWVWAAACAVVLIAAGVTIWAVQDDDDAEDTAPTTTSSTTTTEPTATTEPTTTTTMPTATSEPTTTTVESVAAWINEHRQNDNIQVEIICADTGSIAVGGVLACQTAPVTEPVQVEDAGVIVYVLDATGRSAYDVATDIPRSTEELLDRYQAAPSGLYCRDLLTPDLGPFPFWQGDTPDGDAFLWSLVYWSLEGEPDRMDADLNGIPCETLYAPDVVAQVLAGGFVSA